jgi:CHASE2 domain-containing sensor protein
MMLKWLSRYVRYLFSARAVLASIAIVVIVEGSQFFPIEMDWLDPVGQMLSDFDLTDVVFSKARQDNDKAFEDQVILVNIADDRPTIAAQLRLINRLNPKVVGIDAFFFKAKSPALDSPLVNALRETRNLVLGSQLVFSDTETKDPQPVDIRMSHPMFVAHAKTGFVNQVTEEMESRTIRRFKPRTEWKGKPYYTFGAVIAEAYKPGSIRMLDQRNQQEEFINYRGNIYFDRRIQNTTSAQMKESQFVKFMHFEQEQLFSQAFMEMDPQANPIKDKIVLIGEFDTRKETITDMFYTPLNSHYVGKSYPDMYGVVIHANIISMLIREDYINRMPEWLGLLISLILLHANVAFLVMLHDRAEVWYDLSARALQIILVFSVFISIIFCFYKFDFVLEFNLLIVAILVSGDLIEIYLDIMKRTPKRRRITQVYRSIYAPFAPPEPTENMSKSPDPEPHSKDSV